MGIMKAGQTFTIEPMINTGKCFYTVKFHIPNLSDILTGPYHSFVNSSYIFVGVWHDRLWPDEWTAVTADGKRSAQFEHTLLVSVRLTNSLICFKKLIPVLSLIIMLNLFCEEAMVFDDFGLCI